jgi:hypothetical protein
MVRFDLCHSTQTEHALIPVMSTDRVRMFSLDKRYSLLIEETAQAWLVDDEWNTAVPLPQVEQQQDFWTRLQAIQRTSEDCGTSLHFATLDELERSQFQTFSIPYDRFLQMAAHPDQMLLFVETEPEKWLDDTPGYELADGSILLTEQNESGDFELYLNGEKLALASYYYYEPLHHVLIVVPVSISPDI